MTAYLILTIGSLVFWSLYQMAPSGLMLFAVHNVNLMIGKRGDSAAVDSEHQHRLHHARRAAVRVGLYPDARAGLENRHTAAVCDVAAFDGAGLSHSPVRHQAGRRGRQECVRVALHELRAAEHR